MVIPKLPKLEPWVRFPSPAPHPYPASAASAGRRVASLDLDTISPHPSALERPHFGRQRGDDRRSLVQQFASARRVGQREGVERARIVKPLLGVVVITCEGGSLPVEYGSQERASFGKLSQPRHCDAL